MGVVGEGEGPVASLRLLSRFPGDETDLFGVEAELGPKGIFSEPSGLGFFELRSFPGLREGGRW